MLRYQERQREMMNRKGSWGVFTLGALLAVPLLTVPLLLGSATLSASAQAESPPQSLPYTWADQKEGKVYFAPLPVVEVKVVPVRADDDYWDRISIEVSYPASAIDAQVEQIKKSYPDYERRRVPLSAKGEWKLAIPVLGISDQIQPLPGQEGPYFRQDYDVSRFDSAKVAAALKNGTLVTLEGKVQSPVPTRKSVERIELPASTCQGLGTGGTTALEVLARVHGVYSQIEQMNIKFSETAYDLKNSVLRECLEFKSEQAIDSVQSLVKQELVIKTPNERIAGETIRTVPVPTELMLQYKLVLPGGGS